LLRFEELDIDSVESVMAALSSPEPERVVAAIQLLRDAQRSRLIPALILYHESDEVLLAALDVVAKNDEQQWRPHAVRLLRTRSEAVRVAALRALGRVCEADLVREGLDDPSPAVQTHAAFQLARCAGTDQPEEHPAVIGMLARVRAAPLETRRQMRLALLEALRVDADERWADVMLDIAESDRTPEVVDALAHALVRIVDERFIPLLISWLDLRQARSAVRDALVKLGSPALGALEAALGDASTPDAVRRQIPITIAEFGTQPAADMLVLQLTRESEGLVRYRVLRALSRIRNSHAVRVDTAIIQAEVVRNLREHLRLLALSVPLDDHALPDNARASVLLLKGLISDKMRQALERASRLFKVLYPKEDVRGVFIALRSADRHARANALEFLDALALDCSDECRELLRLATEDSSIHERLARAAAYIPARPTTSSEAIAQLLEDNDEALVALTVYHAHVVDEALDEVDALIAERPSLAYAATAALSQPPPSLAALSEAIDG
jgi:hypothetical protein